MRSRRRLRAALGAGLAAGLMLTAVWTAAVTPLANPSYAAPATAAAVSDRLMAGQRLAAGEQLVSESGSFLLAMQGDGNVVVYRPPEALWASRTFVPGTALVMQGDGNLVAYAPTGTAVWHSGTYGTGADRLVMQDDGNAVLYRPDGRAVWATNTAVLADRLVIGQRLRSGQALVSANGSFRFVMQNDGNLVLYGPWGAVWASSTFVSGTELVMQSDGHLVAYTSGGRPVWFSGTRGSGADRLVMQVDGNAVLYRPDGTSVWATDTHRAAPLALRGQDVTAIPTSRPIVALTFDAGANSAGLASILSTLAAKGVPATFFLTSQWVAANPGAVAEIRSRGHRVANHSVNHPRFTLLSDAAIRQQVLDAEGAILDAGGDPRPLFRFPYGDRDARTIAAINSVGYVGVRWTVDTLGWQGTSGGMTAVQVADRALAALRPGEIVLMHIGSHPTDGSTLDADALPGMIDRIRAQGYGFATMDALFG